MILVLLIGWPLFLWGYNDYKKHHPPSSSRPYKEFSPGEGRMILGCIFLFILSFVIIGSSLKLFEARVVIPKKISVYLEQNQKIETQIGVTIEAYVNHKNQVYKLQSDSDIQYSDILYTLAAYPDLKSNEFLIKHIESYISNNAAISDLREEQICGSYHAFWLYFGS